MMASGNRSTRTGLVAALAALAAVGSGPDVASAETLQAVVRRALESNPELSAIRFNRHAIDHELTAARGLSLPTLDLRSETGRHRDYSRSGLGIANGEEAHRHTGVSGVLSQRLFDGFEARHEQARQRNRVESARWRVNDTANSIALRAVQAYLETQRAEAVLQAARANLSAHRGLLERVTARVGGGRGSSSDQSEAEGRTANAEAVVAEAAGRQRDADAMFRAVIGGPAGKLDNAQVPHAALPKSVDDAVTEAVSASPSVIATQHDATAAEAAIGSAYARFAPRVNLEVSSDHTWGNQEAGDRSIDSRAMVVVRWNLFNGGIDKARVWEAKARALEATEISHNTRRIIERETRVSWSAIQAAHSRVPVLKRQVDQVHATRRAYGAQFEAGQRRLLDLLNIQSESFVAEASLRTEQFVGAYNAFRLLAAVGRLVPALGVDLPDEAVDKPAATVVEGWRDGWTNWRTVLDRYHEKRPATIVDENGTAHALKPTK